MEGKTGLMDPLLSATVDYSKTSYELLKLQTLEKVAGLVSTVMPHTFVIAAVAVVLIFTNLGLAIWLGDILGEIYYGFFIVAAFYLIVGLVLHFFFHNKLKSMFCNYIIKQALN
jgi:hypothetical protein